MHPNFLFIPTLLGSVVWGWLGFRLNSKRVALWARFLGLIFAIVLAIPALLFAIYYLHVLDNAAWFYEFRARPFTELTASSLGFSVGMLLGQFRSQPRILNLTAPVATLFSAGILLLPYVKPVLAPLEIPLNDRWKDGVMLQTTPSTCGPSSAASILSSFGVQESEADLARECFTYRGGTENWYVARAMKRRGFQTHYLITAAPPGELPYPAVAGVRLGGSGGHFIAILGLRQGRYIVGDPLIGRLLLTRQQLDTKYYFTGFFLVVNRLSTVRENQ